MRQMKIFQKMKIFNYQRVKWYEYVEGTWTPILKIHYGLNLEEKVSEVKKFLVLLVLSVPRYSERARAEIQIFR